MKEREKRQYARVDVLICENKKIARAGRLIADVGWLHVAGITYAKRNSTDGFIPLSVAERLTPTAKKVIHTITKTCELWEEIDGGFRIHDYVEWQESSQEIEAKREAKSEAGKVGGITSGISRKDEKAKQTGSSCFNFASPKTAQNSAENTKQTRSKHEANREGEIDISPPPIVPPPSGGEDETVSVGPRSSPPDPNNGVVAAEEAGVKSKRFVPPSPAEAEAVFAARGYGGQHLGEKFVAHYAATGWRRKGNVPIRDWKQAITTWILSRDDRRFDDGDDKGGGSRASPGPGSGPGMPPAVLTAPFDPNDPSEAYPGVRS